MKFRVLVGQCMVPRYGWKRDEKKDEAHKKLHGVGADQEPPQDVFSATPKGNGGPPNHPSSWNPSEVFESETDLVAMYNSRGSEKFERMPDDAPIRNGRSK
jgi:hypothetical protein